MILRLLISLVLLLSNNFYTPPLSAKEANQLDCSFKPRCRYWKEKKRKCRGKKGHTGPTGSTGPTGPTGSTGSTGSTGPTGTSGSFSSYGELISRDEGPIINITDADTWIPVPFNQTLSSSDIVVTTTSPATITVQDPGLYQVGVSLYLLADEAPEMGFTETTYTLGLSLNDSTLPVAAVEVNDPGPFSLNFTSLLELNQGDEIQVYIQASIVAEGPPFDNVVSLTTGFAYLFKIAN